MLNLPYLRDKLVPLRRFSYDGLYSLRYLSQLVQRDRLKAKKVGKNYYSTREWFEEYLEAHAKDETREAYKELFRQVDQNETLASKKITQGKYKAQPILTQVNIFNKILLRRAITTVVVLFVLAGSVYFGLSYLNNKGQIAGEEETATTTKQIYEKN
jgi:hypothetical protein